MHPLSPSPIPLDSSHNHADATITSMERTDSPEPITDEEVALCRSRLDELGISNEDHSNLNSREKELVHMILRLTEPSRPNAAQLVQQATIISELTTQRDFLIQKADEERARWHSEKDSWERSAEALISQRHRKDYYNPRNEDMERIISMLRAENADLRQKVHSILLTQ
ncbi:hypothetical protein K435DRAFT_654282 [Dendrothele bispora CBS 962.96]|uniref:Uncharacterized protein n=1 Tax=Dendrothele bispora (strain CBS 962.96) TaxID=1314807 RepID=A0A4S8MHZ0_DENBC|nr:hypothetical protein K435DRAFT_654282 [Dendrothele bispora CBS 962.96]